jgi:beta-lactamase class A
MQRLIFLCLLIFISTNVRAQTLRQELREITDAYNAVAGVGIISPSGDTISINGKNKFSMQSVFKFPLALYILSQVDKKRLSLDQEIILQKGDLRPLTWSPLRDSCEEGQGVTIATLLKYTICYSDNNGCDILFRVAGGPGKVNQFLRRKRVRGIFVMTTEEQMHNNWQVQFLNSTTPLAMAQLLNRFRKGELLSSGSTKFLSQLMFETITGPLRLKGKLPKEVPVAHKTGTSGYNDGISAATNDVGFVTLPNGEVYCIAVFITASREKQEVNDEIIARISEAVYRYFSKQDNSGR